MIQLPSMEVCYQIGVLAAFGAFIFTLLVVSISTNLPARKAAPAPSRKSENAALGGGRPHYLA